MKTFKKIIKITFFTVLILIALFIGVSAIFWDTDTEYGKLLHYYDSGCHTEEYWDSVYVESNRVYLSDYPDHWVSGAPFYLSVGDFQAYKAGHLRIVVDTDKYGKPAVLVCLVETSKEAWGLNDDNCITVSLDDDDDDE